MNEIKFSSQIFKWFLWLVVPIALIYDVYCLIPILSVPWVMSPFHTFILFLGLSARIGLLLFLIIAKGPIKLFLYFWGGTFILAGSTGLLSYLLNPEAIVLSLYITKAIALIKGLLLVIPTSKYISYKEKNA